MKPTVSVALATYNGELFLMDQLASIARQTYPPSEIVVSDDCSNDATLQILEGFAKTSQFPVRILSDGVRRGFADNFMNAASACRGDYVMFCDQDDVWVDNKIEKVIDEIIEHDAVLCIHNNKLVDKDLKFLSENPENIGQSRTLEKMQHEPYGSVFGNAMTFRTNLLSVIPSAMRPSQPEGNGKSMSHDHWIYQIASVTGNIRMLSDELVLYRQHGGNAYGVLKRSLREKIYYALQGPENRYEAKRHLYARMSDLFTTNVDHSVVDRNEAREISEFYRDLSKMYANKISAYNGKNIFVRAKGLSKTYSKDNVRKWQQRKTSASFAKDILVGVIMANPLYKDSE